MPKRDELLKEMKDAVLRDKQRRRDPRYIRTMAFLTGKGFLFANVQFPNIPNARIQIDDAIWAGLKIEPRILEVLPAAVLRLGKHFDFDPIRHPELAKTLKNLKEGWPAGPAFYGIPYKKLRVWVDFQLKDGRVKTHKERRVLKTFRFKPQTIERLEELARNSKKKITAIIEELVQKA